MSNAKTVAYCSLTILVALYVVGAVSKTPGSLRHEVQTLPLWFPIVLGFRRSELAKWTALPCYVFWLLIMIAIWLFLLGWARIVSGTFNPVEVTMTLIIGLACIAGIVSSLRWHTAVSWLAASAALLLFAAFQVLAMRVSLIPYVANR